MRRAIAAVLLCALLAGCTTEQVIVVDSGNRPLAGVAITPLGSSTRGNTVLTDARGRADVTLQHGWHATEHLEVLKKGYGKSVIGLPELWPLIVRLGSTSLPPVIWTPMTQPTTGP